MVDRKLGRGLDFFLSDRSAPAPVQAPNPAMARGSAPLAAAAGEGVPVTLPPTMAAGGPELRQVPIGDLVANPRQPRGPIDPAQLSELADSIRVSGVLQPILARRVSGKLEIVAGERRWRAAQAAGLKEVPVVVRQITDHESGVFALVENIQREDLNAIEKARAFKQLQLELAVDSSELGRRVGLDRSTVTNFIRLLELAPPVQEHVSRGTLSMGHARALVAVKSQADQIKLADEVIRQGLSVRALEELLRRAGEPEAGVTTPSATVAARADKRAAWVKEIEESLAESLGTPATIKYGRKRSVIQIVCAGRDEFERVLNKLKNC